MGPPLHSSVCNHAFHKTLRISFSGEVSYNCMWFQPRGSGFNVLEIQFGTQPSTVPSFSLCNDQHFMQNIWATQASKYPIHIETD